MVRLHRVTRPEPGFLRIELIDIKNHDTGQIISIPFEERSGTLTFEYETVKRRGGPEWEKGIIILELGQIVSAANLSDECGNLIERELFMKSGSIQALIIESIDIENMHGRLAYLDLKIMGNLKEEDIKYSFTMLNQLKYELGRMFQQGSFADFTLVVNDIEIKAHQVILAASSKYFEKMLSSEMQESKTRRLEIKDFEPKIVQAMLLYIYTGSIRSPNLKDSDSEAELDVNLLSNLLVAADKYQIDNLKHACGHLLCKFITADSAGDLMILAINCSVDYLRARVARFMVAQDNEKLIKLELPSVI